MKIKPDVIDARINYSHNHSIRAYKKRLYHFFLNGQNYEIVRKQIVKLDISSANRLSLFFGAGFAALLSK